MEIAIPQLFISTVNSDTGLVGFLKTSQVRWGSDPCRGELIRGDGEGGTQGGRADGVRTELHMFPAVSLPGRNPPLRSPRKQQVIIRRVANPEQNKSTFLFSCLQKTVLSPTSAVPDRGANISSLLHKSGVS